MAATSIYRGSEPLDAPSGKCEAVTPSDANELAYFTRGLYVGGAGNLVVVTEGGDSVTFTAVPAGTILPVRVKQVKATLTTASNIVALY